MRKDSLYKFNLIIGSSGDKEKYDGVGVGGGRTNVSNQHLAL